MGIHPSVRISLAVLGFIFVFFFCLLVLPTTQQASPQTQTLRQPNDPTPNRQEPTERKRKDSYAHSIPPEIKFNIRNLQSDDWAKDLEIEIKNVSDQHIYFMYLLLSLPEIQIGGTVDFVLRAGNSKFHDKLGTPPEEADTPVIKAGETVIFKIPEKQVENVTKALAERGIPFNVTKVVFDLQILIFGDGTGYFGSRKRSVKKERPSPEISPLTKNRATIPLGPIRAVLQHCS